MGSMQPLGDPGGCDVGCGQVVSWPCSPLPLHGLQGWTTSSAGAVALPLSSEQTTSSRSDCYTKY